MKLFSKIVNRCLRIGIEADISSLKTLSSESYQKLRRLHQSDNIPSNFYLTAISKAVGILASRKKSIRRGIQTKDPYVKRG